MFYLLVLYACLRCPAEKEEIDYCTVLSASGHKGVQTLNQSVLCVFCRVELVCVSVCVCVCVCVCVSVCGVGGCQLSVCE